MVDGRAPLVRKPTGQILRSKSGGSPMRTKRDSPIGVPKGRAASLAVYG